MLRNKRKYHFHCNNFIWVHLNNLVTVYLNFINFEFKKNFKHLNENHFNEFKICSRPNKNSGQDIKHNPRKFDINLKKYGTNKEYSI